ncbi:hypothetical protein M404DRAFT_996326 [Pisolithus tinctorius Marx 270]|uniref:Uncharacterized protein n=1 Tax=Pisolithus tinctorius Marx 270 TaxID=870435 RepID=A0A0C3PMC2_PISTI|nr:hypothetical protein M404DRAFT_996326 [Pisolithus tinctorius Marx 270]
MIPPEPRPTPTPSHGCTPHELPQLPSSVLDDSDAPVSMVLISMSLYSPWINTAGDSLSQTLTGARRAAHVYKMLSFFSYITHLPFIITSRTPLS